LWVKQEIDGWLDVAGIEKGPIFRRVLANGRVGKDALTERAVWQLVREYAAQIGIGDFHECFRDQFSGEQRALGQRDGDDLASKPVGSADLRVWGQLVWAAPLLL
jgi:hypothetical protein